jgi:hypothetical protein
VHKLNFHLLCNSIAIHDPNQRTNINQSIITLSSAIPHHGSLPKLQISITRAQRHRRCSSLFDVPVLPHATQTIETQTAGKPITEPMLWPLPMSEPS